MKFMSQTLYDFSVNDNANNSVSLEKYRGKTLLIVNTASKCGFTPQYDGLEELQKKYSEKDFSVLAFPVINLAIKSLVVMKKFKNFVQ